MSSEGQTDEFERAGQHKLEGSDTTWQDAGNRRQAFYTNLGPGKYSFHVIACNKPRKF